MVDGFSTIYGFCFNPLGNSMGDPAAEEHLSKGSLLLGSLSALVCKSKQWGALENAPAGKMVYIPLSGVDNPETIKKRLSKKLPIFGFPWLLGGLWPTIEKPHQWDCPGHKWVLSIAITGCGSSQQDDDKLQIPSANTKYCINQSFCVGQKFWPHNFRQHFRTVHIQGGFPMVKAPAEDIVGA